ncbi:hypothetical protein [Methylobrevis pamukkalensis]|uniref:Sensor histidine kinase RegB n=1 Tax=Methylobrevis pamukkalensis TaxID=1439726 RepID=A0A1E3GXN5_9HYPH|nr:Sensor histidine kinase RegB [Methylobrevis pamukkalensis]
MKLKPGQVGQPVKLDTLVRLRWLAVGGQLAALAVVVFGLGYELPILPCLSVVGLSALLNVVLKARYPASRRLADRAAAGLLAYDICQLTALLYLTGASAIRS